jgi:hypothetical protein
MEKKLMPDFNFDTRKPQGSDEPNRPRLSSSTANGLRGLLTASKLRILLVAGTLRRFLTVNRRRTLLIGGGIVLFAAAATLGLLIYSSIELAGGDQKDNDLQQKGEDAMLTPLAGCPVGSDRNPSKVMDILHKVSGSKNIVFIRGSESDQMSVNLGVRGTTAGGADVEMYMVNSDGTSLTRLNKTTARKYGADRLPSGRRMDIVWDANG